MVETAKAILNKEILSLRRVVKGSKLGKHITNDILIPILEKIDPFIDEMLDWMGWYISEEIKHTLATAKDGSHWVYEVYYVDPDAMYGQRYTKIGEYTPSAQGGPPYSPDVGGDPDIPPSGTLLRSINYMVEGNRVILGIKDNQTPYHHWYRWGKLFVGDTMEGRSAMDYGAILDDPAYAQYRPYFLDTIRIMKKKMKDRFREQFRKEVLAATRRPTVRRAIEVHFRWREV